MEQLLETYYIDVSDTHNKLQALSESTADTASFVYFDLTINRNSVIMVRSRCTADQAPTQAMRWTRSGP